MNSFFQLMPTLFTTFVTLFLGLLLHKREMSKVKKELVTANEEKEKAGILVETTDKKLSYIPKIMVLKNSAEIKAGVDEIFSKTKATQFLIFVGINGKYDLNSVSCVWYQYKNKEDDINPIRMYSNIDISEDYYYKKLLKDTTKTPQHHEHLDVLKMPNSVLKQIYWEEQVTYSIMGFLTRDKIDESNDIVAFFSCSTDQDSEAGFSELELVTVKRIVNSIIKPSLEGLQKLNTP